ncbi:MAG: ribonuclease P protein component [Acutalibacteraceae bacterium]
MGQRKAGVLNRNTDFRALYYRGRSQVHPLLVTYVRKNRRGVCRIGITTGKKIGKAVKRSRCRRLIREAFRLILPQIEGTWDIVFVARTRTADSSMQQVYAAMKKQLAALSVIGTAQKKDAPHSRISCATEDVSHEDTVH